MTPQDADELIESATPWLGKRDRECLIPLLQRVYVLGQHDPKFADSPRKARIRPGEVLALVADEFACSIDEVEAGSSRKRRYVDARHTAAWLLMIFSGHTLEGVADLLGYADHSSVIHACQAVRARIDTGDPAGRIAADLARTLRHVQETRAERAA